MKMTSVHFNIAFWLFLQRITITNSLSVISEHFLLFSLRAFSNYGICSRTLPEAEGLITIINSSLVVYLL